MTTIAVCVPSGDTVNAGFAYDLARMLTWTASTVDLDLKMYLVQGSRLADQRNALLQQAIDTGCHYALLVDSDMRFPKESLVHLLKREKTFVAANYVTRRMPVQPVTLDEQGKPVYSDSASGLAPVASVGMGLVLVDLAAVARVEQPYFSAQWSSEAMQHEGEDVYFCKKLREAGVEILVDHDLSKVVKHAGTFDYRHEHAAALVEAPTNGTE